MKYFVISPLANQHLGTEIQSIDPQKAHLLFLRDNQNSAYLEVCDVDLGRVGGVMTRNSHPFIYCDRLAETDMISADCQAESTAVWLVRVLQKTPLGPLEFLDNYGI